MSRRAGLYTFINAVVDREAVAAGEYRRLYDLACRLELHELRLLEPMPCGRLAKHSQPVVANSVPLLRRSSAEDSFSADTACEQAVAHGDCRLMPEQVAELRQFHRDTNRRGRGPKVCAFPEIESPEMFGCGAGTFHLFIDPSGNVCPCDFVPLSFGNVLRRAAGERGSAHGRCHAAAAASLFPADQRRAHSNAMPLGHGYPLSPELSRQVAAESPEEPLPDYFQLVAKPFGFPGEVQDVIPAQVPGLLTVR